MRSTGTIDQNTSFRYFLFPDQCAKITPIMNIKIPVAIKEMIIDTKRQYVKNNIKQEHFLTRNIKSRLNNFSTLCCKRLKTANKIQRTCHTYQHCIL